MSTYYVRAMDLHAPSEMCEEKCMAVVLESEHKAILDRLDACQSSREWLQEQNTIEQRRSQELQIRLEGICQLVDRDGYQAKNGGNGGRQFLEALKGALVEKHETVVCGGRVSLPFIDVAARCVLPQGHAGHCKVSGSE